LFFNLQPKQNIILWHLLPKRLFGYVGYLWIWESFFSHLTPMYCANQSSIQTAHNLVFYERTKHIEINCYLTRHHLKYDTIILPFVSSSLQIADFFTKSHFISCFHFSSWQIFDAYSCRIMNLRGDVKKYIYSVLFIKGIITFLV
jgi:hypothetical protein